MGAQETKPAGSPTQPSAAQSGEVALTKPIWEWKREIEQRSKSEVVFTRVFTDKKQNTMTLAADAPHRDVLKRYFQDEDFVARFYRTHVTTVSYVGNEGNLSFVVLNMALAAEWEGLEDGLLGHELGHIDLLSRGYPAWAPGEGPEQCIATQSADLVQHLLIRDEVKRRGIPYWQYWLRNLNAALDRMETQARSGRPPDLPDTCQAAARLGLWADVRLGVEAGSWPRVARFEELMRKTSPELAPLVDRIETRLREAALWDKERYHSALYDVYMVVERVKAAGISIQPQ